MGLICLLHDRGGFGVEGSGGRGGIAEHSVSFVFRLLCLLISSEVCVCQSVCQSSGMLV